MFKSKIYNLVHRQEEMVASWIYQIMYQNGKGIFFVDSVVRGHVNFEQLDGLYQKLQV